MRFFASLTVFALITHSLMSQKASIDSADLHAFLDGVIEAQMQENHIAGATMSVVKDGKLWFSRGYGYSDLEQRIPVDPERTLFRIGSVSKLFVWTAIMQLYEQGKIDLDTDVNEYFKDFQIPEGYDTPVTLKNLMTHTPGFEDYVIGLFAKDSTALRPLGDILAAEMPARVRAPGTQASYSNHGTGMAAYIVEQVSGLSFDEYVEKYIFEPLSMDQTTFRQPLPSRLTADMSVGYNYEGNELKAKDFEYVPLAPVGAASATASDMAKFMITHLQLGTYQGVELLDSTTAKTMQETVVFQHAPNTNPMRFGFMDLSMNGIRVIGHGGDTFWFHSLFALLPEQNLGFFLSFNSASGGGAYLEVCRSLMNRYFPVESPAKAIELSQDELEAFTGTYRSNRFPHQRQARIAALMSIAEVTATEAGQLKLTTSENKYYEPIDPLTFREVGGNDVIVFEKDQQGEATHLYLGNMSIFAFERVPVLDRPQLHTVLAIFSLSLIVLTILWWPIVFLVRREYKTPVEGHLSFLQKLVPYIAGLLLLAFIAAFAAGNPMDVVFGLPATIKTALILPVIAAFFVLLTFVFAFWVIGRRRYHWTGKIHYLLLTVALLIFLWQLYHWNMLSLSNLDLF